MMIGPTEDYTPEEYSGVYAGRGWSVDWNGQGYWLQMEGVGQEKGPLSKHGPPSYATSAEIAAMFYEQYMSDRPWEEEDE